MHDFEALRLALYLFHLPSAVRGTRDKPLPGGIGQLLAVAAGDEGAVAEAAARLERPVEVVRQACAFFIEQVMLTPEADAYRVLGAPRDAADSELRHNMALLLRWVHPDLGRAGDRTIYAARVTRAWEALKTQERRAAYDAANPPRQARQGAGGPAGLPRHRGGMGRGPASHLLGQRPGGEPPAAASPAAAAEAEPKPGLIGIVLRRLWRKR